MSSARVLTLGWLSFVASYVSLFPAATAGVLSLFATIGLSLIAWAGGPRVAQYIGPQIAKAADAIRQAITKRRDPVEGIEATE